MQDVVLQKREKVKKKKKEKCNPLSLSFINPSVMYNYTQRIKNNLNVC